MVTGIKPNLPWSRYSSRADQIWNNSLTTSQFNRCWFHRCWKMSVSLPVHILKYPLSLMTMLILIPPLVTNNFMHLFTFCFCELQECIERCPSLKQEADDSAKGWVTCHLMFFCISFWILFYFNPCSQTVEDHRHRNWKKKNYFKYEYI